MEQHLEKDQLKKDFSRNWVNSSVFLFYLQVFCILAFVIGGSYALWTMRYKGKPEVNVQSSTLYTPEYK